MRKSIHNVRTTCAQMVLNMCVSLGKKLGAVAPVHNHPHLSDLEALSIPLAVHKLGVQFSSVIYPVFPTVHIAYKETKIYKFKHINTYLSGELS